MIFLVANDDGINALGIKRLVETLSSLGDVYVCAPHVQRSASGHGITIGKPLQAMPIVFPNAKKAWECEGTPADCVKVGIHLLELEGKKPDMIFSGINHGGNLGKDTLYSGTVAAAAEGSFYYIQSVAVSVDSHNPEHFDMACRLAKETAQRCYGNLPVNTVININTPDLPEEEIKGVKFAHIGEREYSDHYVESSEGYSLEGEPLEYVGPDMECDVAILSKGYACITPLSFDITDYKSLNCLEERYK